MITSATDTQRLIPDRTNLLKSEPGEARIDTYCLSGHDSAGTRARGARNTPRPVKQISLRTGQLSEQATVNDDSTSTTTPMTFDDKSEKFKLFEDLFHTIIKMQSAINEQMKNNHFHSLLRKGSLQTFRNENSTNRQTLENVLVIFRRNFVKPDTQATAKHKGHRLIFDPNTMKLSDLLFRRTEPVRHKSVW